MESPLNHSLRNSELTKFVSQSKVSYPMSSLDSFQSILDRLDPFVVLKFIGEKLELVKICIGDVTRIKNGTDLGFVCDIRQVT